MIGPIILAAFIMWVSSIAGYSFWTCVLHGGIAIAFGLWTLTWDWL